MKYKISKPAFAKLIDKVLEREWPAKVKVDQVENGVNISLSKFGTSTLYFSIIKQAGDLITVELAKTKVSFFHKKYMADVKDAVRVLFVKSGAKEV